MKEKITGVIKAIRTYTRRNTPEILMAIGIAGMTTSTIMAVKATPKALILIEEEKRRLNHELIESAKSDYAKEYHITHRIEKLPLKNTIRVSGICYIPAISIGLLSIICLIGSSSVSRRRSTALATAYTLSETALKEYQDKVIEEIGPKKESTIRDAVAKEHIDKNPISRNEVIITGKGETNCFDILSGRYFKSDIEKLRRAENELNRQMREENYISLNEFYYEIGLPNIDLGEDLGWNIDHGYIDLHFSSQLDEEGTPCLVIEHNIRPRYDFK